MNWQKIDSNKLKKHKRILLDPFGLTDVEFSEEEIAQQMRDLDNSKAVKRDINKKLEIEKNKSKLLCACRQNKIKEGYWVCVECGDKKHKVGTSK